MRLAKVTGTVVSTQKIIGIQNQKIMMIQPLNHLGNAVGVQIAAMDTVQAGTGDLVYYTMSRESCLALPISYVPVDAAITGIVDQVNVEDTGIHKKSDVFIKEAK